MREKKVRIRRRGNPTGNPNFKTDANPGKLQKFCDEPTRVWTIRVPESLFIELRKLPPSVARERLKNLV